MSTVTRFAIMNSIGTGQVFNEYNMNHSMYIMYVNDPKDATKRQRWFSTPENCMKGLSVYGGGGENPNVAVLDGVLVPSESFMMVAMTHEAGYYSGNLSPDKAVGKRLTILWPQDVADLTNGSKCLSMSEIDKALGAMPSGTVIVAVTKAIKDSMLKATYANKTIADLAVLIADRYAADYARRYIEGIYLLNGSKVTGFKSFKAIHKGVVKSTTKSFAEVVELAEFQSARKSMPLDTMISMR